MKKLSLLFVCILTFASCEKDVLTEEVSIEETMQNSDVYSKKGEKKGNKVPVCHKNGKIIFVNENAISAHTAHGDAVDLDGDGFFDQENSCSTGVDCDDTNADVNPDAEEIFTDKIDNNCNGVVGTIDYSEEYVQCSDCTGGTSGNYKNIRSGKCKYFPYTDGRTIRGWEPCMSAVEAYND